MLQKKNLILVVMALSVSFQVLAEPWSNEVELGFLLSRGNTHNTHFDSRYTNEYKAHPWQNKFSVSSLLDVGVDNELGEKQKTAERYNVLDNFRYLFTQKSFVYNELYGQRDKFSAYDYEIYNSIGLGRKLIDNSKMRWTLEAGPGVKYTTASRRDNSKLRQDEWIGHMNTVFQYAFNDLAEFDENLSFDIGPNTQKSTAKTSIKAKVFDKVALKLSYLFEYNAKLPDTDTNQNHTDTTTSLTATYVF